MRELCRKADIITPNLTELCLLTGASYEELGTVRNIPLLMEVLSELAPLPPPRKASGSAHHRHPLHGRKRDPHDGDLDVTAKDHTLIPFPCIGGSYSGTGDLFAACIAAGMARGDTVTDSVRLAGEFISWLSLTP